ncbi:hypothetical protein [Streptomyces sp. NBC_01235]|uniref:hypothetical protein n=1 Tax=Streptomyces sp. NBC_01235 TaxID=2903788 RepID=UPI002E1147BE|nr:hypothetical protein OG289_45500 [Streptomyces sp. NBC_01235]
MEPSPGPPPGCRSPPYRSRRPSPGQDAVVRHLDVDHRMGGPCVPDDGGGRLVNHPAGRLRDGRPWLPGRPPPAPPASRFSRHVGLVLLAVSADLAVSVGLVLLAVSADLAVSVGLVLLAVSADLASRRPRASRGVRRRRARRDLRAALHAGVRRKGVTELITEALLPAASTGARLTVLQPLDESPPRPHAQPTGHWNPRTPGSPATTTRSCRTPPC